MTAPQAGVTSRQGFLRDLRRVFRGNQTTGRQFGILIALIVIILVFQVLTDGKTLQPGNVINIVQANAYVLILAIGMVMVIIAGHIDLSVGSVAAFVGIVVALAMRDWHLPALLAILLGLAVGVVIGAWQGFWVSVVGVPAFVVTLAGMLFFRGANQAIGNANTVPVPAGFAKIGGGFIPDFGPQFGYSNGTLLLGLAAVVAVVWQEVAVRRAARRMDADQPPLWVVATRLTTLIAVILGATYLFSTGRVGTSFPISGVILAVLVIGYSFVTNRTIIGRHLYAVGGNWRAAELSGVRIRRVNFLVMLNMSVLAALAGMVGVARSVASGPGDGNGWELDAISAVFIGGAAVTGGVGTVSGSIVGGLVIAVLNNGLQLLGVGSDRVQMIKGLVLLIAVGVDVWSRSHGQASLFARLRRRPAAGAKAWIAPGELARADHLSGSPDSHHVVGIGADTAPPSERQV